MHRPRLLAIAACAALAGCDCGGGFDPGRDPRKQDAGTVPLCSPPLVGSGVTLAGGLDGPRKLATDGTHLYFTEAGAPGTGRVSRVPLDSDGGAAVEELATGFNTPDALAVDADYVYFLDEEGLWRVNKTTGQETRLDTLASNALVGESAIRIHEQWLIIATGLEYLVRIGKDGTGQILLYQAPPGATVTGVALEGTDVFFLVAGSGATASAAGLYRVPVDGSSAATRVASSPTLGRDLTVSPDAFLWTEGSAARDGAVRALSRVDGGVTTYADQLWAPSSPVAVRGFVYFQARTDPSPSSPASELFLRMAAACDPLGAPVVGPSGYGPGDLLLHEGTLYFTSLGVAGQGHVGRLR
ncbi:MAG: hypothetical protein M3Y59_16200 [Myxococcota bacterium]|nr:hypothetical protein [Myxococcota bacterium]